MFKPGDKAICTLDGRRQDVEVLYGPFTAASNQEAYLVEWLESSFKGHAGVLWAKHLEPAPKFKVGQRVKISYDEEELVVVAGPYPSEGDNIWVLKDHKGDHYTATEDYMLQVSE